MDLSGLECELCNELVRVPCKSNCSNESSTCNGGIACYTCIYEHYGLDKPRHQRSPPWCISCGSSAERTFRGGFAGNQFSVMTSLFDSLDKVVNSKEHCICSWCGEANASQESLLDHLRVRCPGLVIRCPSCPHLFLGKRSFVFGDHHEKCHAKTKCVKCNFTYRKCDYGKHLRAHLDDFRSKKKYYEKSIQEVEDVLKEHGDSRRKNPANGTMDEGPEVGPERTPLGIERKHGKRTREESEELEEPEEPEELADYKSIDMTTPMCQDPLDILLGEV
jgi:hypothetical protein